MPEGEDFGSQSEQDVKLKVSSEIGRSAPVTTAEAEPAASEATARAPSALLERPHIVARDVSVGFGSKTVLSDINLEFHPRQITALIGPTGCGKSTLLRSFNRMNDKVRGYWRKGSIELEGVEVSDAQLHPLVLRKRVGMVFQRPNPFPMSIKDNVVVGVKVHRMAPRQALHGIAERFLKHVGLWAAVADRMNDSPFRLSGGQQQLLCLARALAVEPDVLLLDEPTSSLDPGTTEIVEDLLRDLAPHLTMVIVTHNLAQAKRVAQRTAFLYNGRLVEVGDTQQIFEAPNEPETVSYVSGRMG